MSTGLLERAKVSRVALARVEALLQPHAADPDTAAVLAILRPLWLRLSGPLRDELTAIILPLFGPRSFEARFDPTQQRDEKGRWSKRTGVLGNVIDQLGSLRDKLSDDDRAVLDQAMNRLRGLESSDVDDDDLIEDEPDEDEEDSGDESDDLVMESANGDLTFTPYLSGEVDVDWDDGSVRFTPQQAREVSAAVTEFAALPVVEAPEMPEWEVPDTIATREEYIAWRKAKLNEWYESSAWDARNAVVGEMTTSDGELKVRRGAGGTIQIGDPDTVDDPDGLGLLHLDDPHESQVFVDFLRIASDQAGPSPQASVSTSFFARVALSRLRLDAHHSEHQPRDNEGRFAEAPGIDVDVDIGGHLPGKHDQKSHGRRKKPAVDVDVDVPEITDQPTPTTAEVRAGDFGGLKRVGGQLGSNRGALFEDADGQRWYVKDQRSDLHARNEALAAALYAEAGVNVPEVVTGKGAPGFGDGLQTASKWQKLDTSIAPDKLGEGPRSYLKADLQRGFAVDAWLANWDVAGLTLDNVALDEYGEVLRVDPGGSMMFRAQGAPKGDLFGDSAAEFDTLRDPAFAPQASRLFGDMSDLDLAESGEALERVGPTKIRQLVSMHGMDDALADRLIARRNDIVRRADAIRAKMEADAGGGQGEFGRTERAALAVPNGSLPDKEYGYNDQGMSLPDNQAEIEFRTDPGWSREKRAEVSRVLRNYRQGTFRDINEKLRGQSSADTLLYRDGVNRPVQEPIAAHIRELDDAYAASPLAEPVEAWRGLQHPEQVFGDAWSDEDMTGVEWTEHGYMSTSASKGTATGFGGKTMLRVLVPAGVGALKLSGWHTHERRRGEAEIALQRGLKLRVVDDVTIPQEGMGGFNMDDRILTVEVLPVSAPGMQARARYSNKAKRERSPGEQRMVMDYPVEAARPNRGQADLRELAGEGQPSNRALLNHPGHPDQSVHGRKRKKLPDLPDIAEVAKPEPAPAPKPPRKAPAKRPPRKAKEPASAPEPARQVVAEPKPQKTAPAEKTPRVVAAEEHVKKLTASLPASVRKPVTDELMRQAQIAPGSVMKLRGMGFDDLGDGFAEYKYPAGTIDLSHRWKTNKRGLDASLKASLADGYLAPSGSATPLGAVVAHEFGHRIAFRSIDPKAPGMRRSVSDKLLGALAGAIGVSPPTAPRGDWMPYPVIKNWMATHRKRIASQLSEYGSESVHEMLGEAWQEFSTMGDKARPAAKAVGGVMLRMHEGGAS